MESYIHYIWSVEVTPFTGRLQSVKTNGNELEDVATGSSINLGEAAVLLVT